MNKIVGDVTIVTLIDEMMPLIVSFLLMQRFTAEYTIENRFTNTRLTKTNLAHRIQHMKEMR